MTVALAIHELLCAALFYTVFCRAVKSNADVKTDVRLAFFALGSAAIMGMVAPLAWGHQPSIFDLALLSSVVLVQILTAHHWRDGVPEHFLHPQRRPRNRRRQDRQGAL